ncbi:thiopurine S-methyltransferase [Pseudomonas gingeri]|uniref:Thiopurine S-methyltransferase n=1 Tax=Pseudomonas gingeri TaxID=117681 RepID=A0A7Y7YB02_9PSED|nr:thiopurine S-methyltransferase [Pseudomonas gingeri]NWA00033.1 thiopurine S-methyltransferase [Pseudomonas gingeri]NWA16872.1 thiopurine S-methyltransferase [Pseudomonas gingeri]NWA53742.1 thiopurine S-methyltransferase [Pseudomonas gingeri]NWA93974.1 thiopurine S-methyltransferase [Pseudomonas gingeri]NWB02126.1 thiopurine S-methyltransferase [Pseudomonas gingeri]
MQPEFWHKRWEFNQIGFHLDQVNPCLQRFWPDLTLAPEARVLVPLCGKSLDLAWLAAQGLRVLGVELSEKAVEAFFAEQQLKPQVHEQGALRIYEAGPLELWCGDFFALTAADVADCTALYDRAALIALPPQMRERYAAHLTRILPGGCQGLLITLDYAQAQIDGPPFAVLDGEVRRLLEPHWQLRMEEERDVLGESWKFLQAGVTRLEERVYRLEKNP